MAKLEPGFFFTGALGNISAYRMNGTDKIVLRHKGGASKRKIKTLPQFELTRQNNTEFSGRSKAARILRQVLHPLDSLADHKLMNSMQPLLRAVQLADTTSPRGQRNVCGSYAPHLLSAYSLNKKITFDSIVRSPVVCQVERQSHSATIILPALVPRITFFPQTPHPLFRLVVCLGVYPNLYYDKTGYRVGPEYLNLRTVHATGDWHYNSRGCEETALALQLPAQPGDDHCLVVAAGICFGTVEEGGVFKQQKRSGAARVIGVG